MTSEFIRVTLIFHFTFASKRLIYSFQYDHIQADLYPLTHAGIPSLEATEWFEGTDKPPILKSITEDAIDEYRVRAKTMYAASKPVERNNSNKDNVENMTKDQVSLILL